MILALVFPLCLSAHSGTVVLKRDVKSFKPTNGSLKEFSLFTETKKTMLGGSPSYSTDLRMVLKTQDVADIQDYAVIQYIRGCQYRSTPEGKKYFSVSRDYFNGTVIFKHPVWMIDSESFDPIYTSWKGDRFALFRWNANPASFNVENATYLSIKPTPHPIVFATDLPGSSSADAVEAKNSSLEFKTCVFKYSDVPPSTTADGLGIDVSKALSCLTWESKFTYDFNKKDFVIGGALDPFCLDLGTL